MSTDERGTFGDTALQLVRVLWNAFNPLRATNMWILLVPIGLAIGGNVGNAILYFGIALLIYAWITRFSRLPPSEDDKRSEVDPDRHSR